MFDKLSYRTVIGTILFFALVKLLVLFYFVHNFQLWEDHYIALNILKEKSFYIYSDGIKCYSYQFPVYPFLLAVIYFISGISPITVAIFHIILSSFTAWFIYKVCLFFTEYFQVSEWILRKKNTVAFFSALWFILHPAIVYYSLIQIHPFTLDIFMLFFSLYLMTKYIENKNYLPFYILTIGLTVLTRGTLVVSTIPLVIILWEKEGFIKITKQILIIGLLAFLTNTPWLIRNYYKDGIIGYQSIAPRNLWVGSLKNGEGSNYLLNGKNYYQELSQADIVALQKLNPKEQYDFFTDKWKKNISDDPIGFAKLFLLKLNNFWFFRQHIGNEYSDTLKKMIPVYKMVYLIILLLACIAVFFMGWRVIALICIPIVLSLMQAFFYVETRHRLIIEPILIYLAIITLFTFIVKLQSKINAFPSPSERD